MPLALATFAILFLQAAAPGQPSAPVPAGQAPPPSAAAPPPPRPMVPVSPRSPADLTTFLAIFSQEKSLAKENKDYYDEAQRHLSEDQVKMQGLEQFLQKEFQDLKTKEGWAEDVRFNPQTEKFEKPLPGGTGEKGQPAASPAKEKKP